MDATHQRNEAIAPAVAPSDVEEFAKALGLDMNAIRADSALDPEERARRAEARSQRALAEARAADRLARFEADVGEKYRQTDWTHPKMQPFLAVSQRVMAWQPGGRGLLVTGPSGRGKTRAVSALYRRLAIEEGRDVRYFNAADWFAMLGEQVNYGKDDARPFINRHARYPIFILDDMGQQARVSKQRDEHVQAWFFRFLDIRRAEGLPLIMTTNLSAREIAASDDPNGLIRADPLMVRLFDLCEIVSYETDAEAEMRRNAEAERRNAENSRKKH